MEIRINVKMSTNIMYNFLLHHAYSSLNGILCTILGFLAVVVGVINYTQFQQSNSVLIYIVFGLICILYLPLSLYIRAKKQVMLSPVFKKEMCYILSETGIETSQDEASTSVKWDEIFKVTSTSKSIIVYLDKMRALILPKEIMGNNYEAVLKLISAHVEPGKVKVKQ